MLSLIYVSTIVDVQIFSERDDVLLTAAGGQCIRFPVTDVRVFTVQQLVAGPVRASGRDNNGNTFSVLIAP